MNTDLLLHNEYITRVAFAWSLESIVCSLARCASTYMHFPAVPGQPKIVLRLICSVSDTNMVRRGLVCEGLKDLTLKLIPRAPNDQRLYGS